MLNENIYTGYYNDGKLVDRWGIEFSVGDPIESVCICQNKIFIFAAGAFLFLRDTDAKHDTVQVAISSTWSKGKIVASIGFNNVIYCVCCVTQTTGNNSYSFYTVNLSDNSITRVRVLEGCTGNVNFKIIDNKPWLWFAGSDGVQIEDVDGNGLSYMDKDNTYANLRYWNNGFYQVLGKQVTFYPEAGLTLYLG